jgi:tetratricopeptide (TPR) repeat protein
MRRIPSAAAEIAAALVLGAMLMAALPCTAQDPPAAASPNPAADNAFNRGIALQEGKRYAEAAYAFTQAIEFRASFTDAHFDRGLCLAHLGRWEESAADFSVVIKNRPKLADAYLERGRAYLALGQTGIALADLSECLTLHPERARADYDAITAPPGRLDAARAAALHRYFDAFSQGITRADQQDFAGAAAAFTDALQAEPTAADAYLERGRAHLALGKPDDAFSDFSQFRTRDPIGGDDAYDRIAAAYADREMYAEQAQAFTKFIDAHPADVRALYHRGAAYTRQGRYADAVTDIQAYRRSRPNDTAGRSLLADAVFYSVASKMPSERTEAYAKAVAADPNNADLRLNYGVALLQARQVDASIAEFDKAIALNPKHEMAYYDRAVAYVNKKDWASVIKDTTAALEIKPDYTDALITRADAHLNRHENTEAAADYRRFLTLKPGDPYALKNLAVAEGGFKP